MSLKQMINGQLVNIAGGSPASASTVSYNNTTSGMSATNVQDGLDELNASYLGVFMRKYASYF